MKLLNYGVAQAQRDFHKGLGRADNPYPKDAIQHKEYSNEMAVLWNNELKDIRQEMKHAHTNSW